MKEKSLDKLRIGIQKSGRLAPSSIHLLKECGIDFGYSSGTLKSICSNFYETEILFLRQEDIPNFIKDRVIDAGIIGNDIYSESDPDLNLDRYPLKKIASCTICVSVPSTSQITKLEDLNGKRVATCYPKALKKFLDENKINASVVTITAGSVGIATSIGLADAIYDIVVTGTTIIANSLRKLAESVQPCDTMLISNPSLEGDKLKYLLKLKSRINSVIRAKSNKYIVLNAPKKSLRTIAGLLPGMQAPTIINLNIPGWIAIHAVISEDDFWDIIENLTEAGATDILVMPIEKMISDKY